MALRYETENYAIGFTEYYFSQKGKINRLRRSRPKDGIRELGAAEVAFHPRASVQVHVVICWKVRRGTSHIALFYPKQSARFGTELHKAANRFAIIAEEGESLASYNAVGKITKN